jgi:cytochrome bd-type quinol oxidase subunit 2
MQMIERLVIAATIVVIVVLTVTALPSLGGGDIHGRWLLVHMMASGALVFLLPVFGVLGLARLTRTKAWTKVRAVAFWMALLCGFLTIGTMFAGMMPIASTEQMHVLIAGHGIIGYALSLSIVLFLVSRKKAIE